MQDNRIPPQKRPMTDCEYEIAYTDTGLELTAGKGTATQGVKFTLNRTEK